MSIRLHTAIIAGGLVVFATLAWLVGDGEPLAADRYLMLLLRDESDPSQPMGPEWFAGVVRDFTALGSIGVLSFVTLAVGGFLALQRNGRMASFVVGSVATGMLLSWALKGGFDRARPDLVPHAVVVYSPAFPSGHALLSAVTYLTLAALLAHFQPQRRLQIWLVCTAFLLTVLVGSTRIFLGVHWPSDVLAGWAVGAAWASACQLLASRLDAQGWFRPQLA